MAFSGRLSLVKIFVIILPMVLTGCAVGEIYETAKSKIPAVKSDMGRIFVYRSRNPFGILKPRVFILDGKAIGDTYASTVIYHDTTPGKHVVNFNEGRNKLDIDVPAGGAIYVKYSIVSDDVAIGNTWVEVIDPKVAEADLPGIQLVKTQVRHPDEVK